MNSEKKYYKRRWKAITLITVFPLFYLYHFSTRSDLGRRCSKLLSVEKSMQMKINSFRFAMQISSFCVWKGNSRFFLPVQIFWQLCTKIDNFFSKRFLMSQFVLCLFWRWNFWEIFSLKFEKIKNQFEPNFILFTQFGSFLNK